MKLIITDNHIDFEKEINAMLAQGYMFHGNMNVHPDRNGNLIYIQAMVNHPTTLPF